MTLEEQRDLLFAALQTCEVKSEAGQQWCYFDETKVFHAIETVTAELRKETHCPKCNQPWEEHDFGVPSPYCL